MQKIKCFRSQDALGERSGVGLAMFRIMMMMMMKIVMMINATMMVMNIQILRFLAFGLRLEN